MEVVELLKLILIVLIFIIFILIGIYVWLEYKLRMKETEEVQNEEPSKAKKEDDFGRFHGVLTRDSIRNFMEFDDIVDNMIVRKNRTQYVMVIQCNGVNYDLLSEQEKLAVEEGFVQFLNTLRFPIQLYVQTRSLNLRDIIDEYKVRVDALVAEINKLKEKAQQAEMHGNKPMAEKLKFEIKRKQNVLEYGMNITEYVEKMSLNKNVLQQKTYVVVSYYTAEFGGKTENYSKEEMDSMCFSELYTRCQNVISALATSEITSRILDSEELAELLYVAYNRDDSELMQLSKALDAQYDRLYSTGKDVLEKRKRQIEEEINYKALDIVTDSVVEAGKKQELNKIARDKKIKQKALEILDEYKGQMDTELYNLTKKEVEKATEASESKN